MKRLGTAQEIADMAIFLCEFNHPSGSRLWTFDQILGSSRATYITGAAMVVSSMTCIPLDRLMEETRPLGTRGLTMNTSRWMGVIQLNSRLADLIHTLGSNVEYRSRE